MAKEFAQTAQPEEPFNIYGCRPAHRIARCQSAQFSLDEQRGETQVLTLSSLASAMAAMDSTVLPDNLPSPSPSPASSSPGKVFGYGRRWFEDEEAARQRAAVEEHFRTVLQPQGYTWAGWFEDAPAARDVSFSDRPGGQRVSLTAERGDLILAAEACRAFRHLRDLSSTLQVLLSMGVVMRLLDLPELDTSTAPGRWAVRLLEKAQALADTAHGEIVKAGHARSKARGKPTGKAPYGYKIARNGGRKRFVPDPQERAIGAKIVEWKQAGYSWEQIRTHLLENRVETKHGAMWSLRKIQDAYQGELQLRATEQARAAAASETPVDG